jgi:hypothetical protein
MNGALLQSGLPGLLGEWLNGNWFDAMLAPYYNLIGEAGFALMIVAPMSWGLYARSGDIRVPAIVLVLFMGLLIGGVPASLSIALYLLVAVAFALGGARVVAGR